MLLALAAVALAVTGLAALIAHYDVGELVSAMPATAREVWLAGFDETTPSQRLLLQRVLQLLIQSLLPLQLHPLRRQLLQPLLHAWLPLLLPLLSR